MRGRDQSTYYERAEVKGTASYWAERYLEKFVTLSNSFQNVCARAFLECELAGEEKLAGCVNTNLHHPRLLAS